MYETTDSAWSRGWDPRKRPLSPIFDLAVGLGFLVAGIALHLGFERWAFATYDIVVELVYSELRGDCVWAF